MDFLKPFLDLEKELNRAGKTINQLGKSINRLGNSTSLFELPIFEEKKGEECKEPSLTIKNKEQKYISALSKVEEALRDARQNTECEQCIKSLDTIIKMFSSKKINLIENNKKRALMKKKGYKSWSELDEKTKEEVKREAEKSCVLCERAKDKLCGTDAYCRQLIQRAFIEEDTNAQDELKRRGLFDKAANIIIGVE